MYSSVSSIRHACRSSSLISLLALDHGGLAASRSFSAFPGNYGPQQSCQDGIKSFANVVRKNISHHVGGLNGSSGLCSSIMHFKGNVTAPYAMSFLASIHSSSRKDILSRGGNPMNFVRGIIEEDERGIVRNPQLPRHGVERSADFVHIKLMRNNCFVTVTDSNGNKKLGASVGVKALKGIKATRYNGEAIAELVGRKYRSLGLKSSVVVRVKGFTHFKKKKQAILSWREGYSNSRTDQNPIVSIEDTTRKPHNGCRLPKRRRT